MAFIFLCYVVVSEKEITINNGRLIRKKENLNIEKLVLLPEQNCTIISESAFNSSNLLRTVSLCSTVIIIEKYAYCNNLHTVILPETLNIIGERAFYSNTKNLTIVTNGLSFVKYFGHQSFANTIISDKISTKSMVGGFLHPFINVTFKSEVEIIFNSQYMFEHAIFLSNVFISYTRIAQYCFFKAKFLKVIDLRNISTIPKGSFQNAEIEELILPDYISSIYESSFENCIVHLCRGNFNIIGEMLGDSAFLNAKIDTEISISKSNASMVYNLFMTNSTLWSKLLIIPPTVKSIGSHAFANSLIEAVRFEKYSTIEEYSFAECSQLRFVEGIDYCDISESVFKKCYKLGGKYAFHGDVSMEAFRETSIEEVFLNISLVRVRAFRDCKNLKNVTFGPRVTCIEAEAFMNADLSETDLIIPNETFVFAMAFASTKLRSVKIFGIVSSGCFENNDNLKYVYFNNGIVPIGCFANCPNLLNVTMYNVDTVLSEAFQNTSIKVFEIANKVDISSGNFIDSIVEKVIYHSNKPMIIAYPIFANTPVFEFPNGYDSDTFLGYSIKPKINNKMAIIIGCTIGGCVLLVSIVGAAFLYQKFRSKRLEDRLTLEKAVMNDFG